jgi:hypothetical protein
MHTFSRMKWSGIGVLWRSVIKNEASAFLVGADGNGEGGRQAGSIIEVLEATGFDDEDKGLDLVGWEVRQPSRKMFMRCIPGAIQGAGCPRIQAGVVKSCNREVHRRGQTDRG